MGAGRRRGGGRPPQSSTCCWLGSRPRSSHGCGTTSRSLPAAAELDVLLAGLEAALAARMRDPSQRLPAVAGLDALLAGLEAVRAARTWDRARGCVVKLAAVLRHARCTDAGAGRGRARRAAGPRAPHGCRSRPSSSSRPCTDAEAGHRQGCRAAGPRASRPPAGAGHGCSLQAVVKQRHADLAATGREVRHRPHGGGHPWAASSVCGQHERPNPD